MTDNDNSIEVSDHDIATAMYEHGGGFVSALATAWFKGDDKNRPRIQREFDDYWTYYRIIATRLKRRSER